MIAGRFAVALACIALTGTVAMGDSWTTEPALPTGTFASSATVLNGSIYVAGGFTSSGPTSALQVFTPGTNTWSSAASMPGARYDSDGAQTVNNQIYFIGGWTSLPNNNLFVYSPNSWSNGSSLPSLSGGGVSGVINGAIYTTSPDNGFSGYSSAVYKYDTTLQSWSSVAAAPNPRDGSAGGVINGLLYVAGGGNSTELDVFDPVGDDWTTEAPLPTAVNDAEAGVIDGDLYLVGGFLTSGQTTSIVQVYNPLTNTWTSDTPAPFAFGDGASAVVGNTLYVFGGNTDDSGSITDVEALTVAPTPASFPGALLLIAIGVTWPMLRRHLCKRLGHIGQS
jgi:N-acetylneuraminic acid mutarotase